MRKQHRRHSGLNGGNGSLGGQLAFSKISAESYARDAAQTCVLKGIK